jgi:hypothetical protein
MNILCKLMGHDFDEHSDPTSLQIVKTCQRCDKVESLFNVRQGDVVMRKDSGHHYVVHNNNGLRVIAVKTEVITNPDNWLVKSRR